MPFVCRCPKGPQIVSIPLEDGAVELPDLGAGHS